MGDIRRGDVKANSSANFNVDIDGITTDYVGGDYIENDFAIAA